MVPRMRLCCRVIRERAVVGAVRWKDVGWSWLVLLSGFVVYGLGFGMVNSYGVYTETWREDFNCTTKAATSVSSVANAFVPLTGN